MDVTIATVQTRARRNLFGEPITNPVILMNNIGAIADLLVEKNHFWRGAQIFRLRCAKMTISYTGHGEKTV